jgi:hypothetical protein
MFKRFIETSSLKAQLLIVYGLIQQFYEPD